MPRPVPSHSVEFQPRELLRRLAAPAFGVLILAAFVHAASLGGLLPAPAPSNLDQAVLDAKADLASRSAPASLILLGDSSCMMDVDAPALAQLVRQPVVNLGTLSYLDLAAHGLLLNQAVLHASDPPREVVLLLHPASLLRGSSEPALEHYLRRRLDRHSHFHPHSHSANTRSRIPPAQVQAPQSTASLRSSPALPSFLSSVTERWLGGGIVREQFVQPVFPSLLRGEFAAAYGTTWRIHRLLMQQSGTLADPTRFDPGSQAGRYEFHLNPRLEKASRELRSRIPAGCRFSVGLTPLPESLALERHADRITATLEQLAGWLQPDRVLAGLPSVLPDAFFATATHLNADGSAEFTRLLGTELAR
ncbi:MAG: hypothetical protein AB7J34_20730 [Limisphaerales bacterium]